MIMQTMPQNSPWTLCFLLPEILAEFQWITPRQECQIQVGWVKISGFLRNCKIET